jgi:GTP cyclohydrolase I
MLLSTLESELKKVEEIGDEHMGSKEYTPLREDAFDMSDKEKIATIALHFEEIMKTLGLDLTDDSLSGTPLRVAKMYVQEVFSGLNPENKPSFKLFENSYDYNGMVAVRDIELYSYCEHHFVPIIGKVHVAYKPNNNKVVGLSKLNRIVQHFAKRPQVQERLNKQIVEELKESLQTDDVAVVIDAVHLCVASRGIKDTSSSTVTAIYEGDFKNKETKREFLQYIQSGVKPA